MNHWPKIFAYVCVPRPIGEEIIENATCSDWLDCSKHYVIIIFFLELVLERFIGFIHLNKLLVSFLIIWIFFRMVLEGLLSVCMFYLLKSSCPWNP